MRVITRFGEKTPLGVGFWVGAIPLGRQSLVVSHCCCVSLVTSWENGQNMSSSINHRGSYFP